MEYINIDDINQLRENSINTTSMPYYSTRERRIKFKSIGLLSDGWKFPERARHLLTTMYSNLPDLQVNMSKADVIAMLRRHYYNNPEIWHDTGYWSNSSGKYITDEDAENPIEEGTERIYSRGGMKNKKVKKCEEKKVVLGKERCIYKVSGSKKDYMKYKGELVPVSDYVKSMKKKK